MASSREYLDHVLERLNGLDGISYRAMMGEYILYLRGKIIGGIYDDRLLVKPVDLKSLSAFPFMAAPKYELPYEGAKEMLLVEEVDNGEFLRSLFETIYASLPEPKTRSRKAANAKTDGAGHSRNNIFKK